MNLSHIYIIYFLIKFRDRFILIYCPSYSKRYCNIRKGKLFVFISLIIVFIVNGHLLLGYQKIKLYNEQLNVFYDCNIPVENTFYKNLFTFYDSYIESIFLIIIPFSIMFICSLLIIFQILQTRKTIHYNKKGKYYYYKFHSREIVEQSTQNTVNEQKRIKLRDKDLQLCWMLIGTTLTFLILCLPTEINDIFNYIGREHSCLDWFRKVLLMLLQQIYYAGHFYIYTLTGPIFRKHLYGIFSNQHRHQENINQESRYLTLRLLGDTYKISHSRSSMETFHQISKSTITQSNVISQRTCTSSITNH